MRRMSFTFFYSAYRSYSADILMQFLESRQPLPFFRVYLFIILLFFFSFLLHSLFLVFLFHIFLLLLFDGFIPDFRMIEVLCFHAVLNMIAILEIVVMLAAHEALQFGSDLVLHYLFRWPKNNFKLYLATPLIIIANSFLT